MRYTSREAAQLSSVLSVAVAGALLTAGASFWLANVDNIVPEPYLDEEFHVRQAQVYCKGDFQTWDPKITTPPGLYLVSWIFFRITGQCSIFDLRLLNVVTVVLGYLLTVDVLRSQRTASRQLRGSLLANTSANIWLFPPLFFFSGLYYTDVQSAFWTLLAYRSYLRYEQRNFSSWIDALLQVCLGITALFFRQTNIFWVAVFPAGLALATSATKFSSRVPGAFGAMGKRDLLTVMTESWKKLKFYDLPVYEAGIEDYALTSLSLVVVTVGNWKRSLSILLPYITLIAGFAGFVVWNGGVVLGDKSNHVATLHLSQMLYLWPYILFFSWPLVVGSLLMGHVPIELSISDLTRKIFVLGTLTNLAMVIIHYNTIVHPFTLADNRHYVFYVFRVLMRREEIKYLAAPVYILCGYVVLQTLGAKPAAPVLNKKGRAAVPSAPTGCSSSFLLVWLITTTLSLVSAPLVEPRYCIIPWIMWRLRVPPESTKYKPDTTSKQIQSDTTAAPYGAVVETAWFIAIAVGTGYMFLYRGFAWPQEPGRVQRFMW